MVTESKPPVGLPIISVSRSIYISDFCSLSCHISEIKLFLFFLIWDSSEIFIEERYGNIVDHGWSSKTGRNMNSFTVLCISTLYIQHLHCT